jgi:hypothetical protein
MGIWKALAEGEGEKEGKRRKRRGKLHLKAKWQRWNILE